MNYSLLLANVGRHIQLTAEEQACFTALLRPRTVRRRQYVVQAGEECRYETFVVQGCLRAYYVDANGFEHNLMFAVEDWWTGDLFSFLTGTPASLNVEALEDSEVLQLDKPALEQLYQQVPKFERYFRLMIQNAFVAQQQRIVAALSASAEERYRAFRSRYPALEQRVPQRHIASYLGVTPEFLSKLRKQVLRADASEA
jgi:CRP-like cAMP-binding protein